MGEITTEQALESIVINLSKEKWLAELRLTTLQKEYNTLRVKYQAIEPKPTVEDESKPNKSKK